MRRPRDRAGLNEEEMERALAQLRLAVRERGLNHSLVRESVARVALRMRGHFSVDDLLKEMQSSGLEAVHPTTVYRLVPLLVETGLLATALASAGGSVRYERAFGREQHAHLLCTACGKVVEFQLEAITRLQRQIAEQLGFRLRRSVLELLGTCVDCQQAAG